MRAYIADLRVANGDLRGILTAYDPATIRKIFYRRVFERSNPEAPHGAAATALVKYKNKIFAYSDLHHCLLEEINELVATMTTPAAEEPQEAAASGSRTRTAEAGQQRGITRNEALKEASRSIYSWTEPHGSSPISSHELTILAQQAVSPCYEGVKGCSEEEEQSRVQRKDHTEPIGSPSLHRHVQQGLLRGQSGSIQQTQHVAQSPPVNTAGMTDRRNSSLAFENSQLLSSMTNESVGEGTELEFAATSDSVLRVHTRLGNPATARFSPTAGSPFLSTEQKETFQTRGIHHSSVSLRVSESKTNHQALQGGQSNSYLGNLGLRQPTYSSSVTEPQANEFQPATVAAGHPFDRSGRVSGLHSHVASAQIDNSSAMQHASIIGRRESNGQGYQGVHAPSQSSHVQGSNQDMIPLGTYIHEPHNDHPQHQTQLFLQAQMRAQVQDAFPDEYQSEVFMQSQGSHGLNRQVQSQATPINQPERYAVIPPPGFAPLPFSAASSQSFSMPNQPFQIPIQHNQTCTPMNPYEHKMPLPYTQFPESEAYREGQGIGMTPAQSGGHSYTYGLNAEIYSSTSYRPIAGAMNNSYVQPYIPADKYARAPAPNRLASRFAQVHAMPPIQTVGPFNKSSMPQSRFSTPLPSPRAILKTLPYHSGSNDMYPFQRPGVASMRYQNLTRDEPPSFGMAGHEDYIPFVETTRLSKPAEWGVLKISNVSTSTTNEDLGLCLRPFL